MIKSVEKQYYSNCSNLHFYVLNTDGDREPKVKGGVASLVLQFFYIFASLIQNLN